MAKLILNDLANLQNEATTIANLATNNAAIEIALENTLSRDGTSPNTMSASLDMNSNSIVNLPIATLPTHPVRLQEVGNAPAYATAAAASATTATAQATTATTQAGIATTQAATSTTQAGIATAAATSAVNAASALALQYTWSTNTASSDPTSGKIKVNNAAPGSATELYLSETDAFGSNLASEISRWGLPTAVAGKTRLKISKDPASFLFLTITSTVTDNGTWDTYTVSGGLMTGSFSNGDTVYLEPALSGNDGAGGDASTNTATSVDSEVALFSGTGGKTLKRASGSGIAKLTSGVLSTATAGTDYYNPGGTDVALADGGTGTSLTDPNADRIMFWDDSLGAVTWLSFSTYGLEINGTTLRPLHTFGIALSDETTAITTGTNKATMSLPRAFTVTNVYATLNTVSSSGIPTVDINEAGTTILSTKLTIDANEKTSATAATPFVISDASIAANAEIGFDIDVAGTGAKGLKVFIEGYWT